MIRAMRDGGSDTDVVSEVVRQVGLTGGGSGGSAVGAGRGPAGPAEVGRPTFSGPPLSAPASLAGAFSCLPGPGVRSHKRNPSSAASPRWGGRRGFSEGAPRARVLIEEPPIAGAGL